MKRKRLKTTGRFGEMNPIQQVLHRWCTDGERLALLCQVTPITVSRWFDGSSIPNGYCLDAIACVCGINRTVLGKYHTNCVSKAKEENVSTPKAFTLKELKEAVVHINQNDFLELFEHFCSKSSH